MEYEILRGPYLLLETVELLFRFVNGVSYQSLLSKRRVVSGGADEAALVRRLEQLQKIMEEACRGLDPEAPALRYFFERVDTAKGSTTVCLARCLTFSFSNMEHPGFEENVEQLARVWYDLQDAGAWIKGCGPVGLDFTCDEGCPGELIEQICALKLPAEFQLRLYRALRNFDKTVSELADLIRPVARRLEAVIGQADWIVEGAEAYWRESSEAPMDYIARIFGGDAVQGAGERTKLIISPMNYTIVFYDTERSIVNHSGCNFLYIGCGVTAQSALEDREALMDNVSTTLRALSDRRRLEILRRLSRERSYCHELAELLGADPGNMSRTLAILHNYGFLRQEREAMRNYYQTDREAIHEFFQQVEDLLFH